MITFLGGREEAKRIVRALVASTTGRERSDAARGVFIAIGMAALSDIHGDFIVKARGGAGADGTVWPRLSPKTLAYSRRFGPGEQSASKKAAGLGRAHRHAPGKNTGLLTMAELKQWRGLYASGLARFAASMPLGEAKAKAAAIAWKIMKARGAKTKLEVYGHREHEILRDTGVLANSLSVGVVSGNEYQRPTEEGGDQQIFSLLQNGVIVGTNVPYAKAHQEGIGVPKRPILPKFVPEAWKSNWLNAAAAALQNALELALQKGAA